MTADRHLALVGSRGAIGQELKQFFSEYCLLTDESYLEKYPSKLGYDLGNFDEAIDLVSYCLDHRESLIGFVILVGKSNSGDRQFNNAGERWRFFFEQNFFAVTNIVEALIAVKKQRQIKEEYSVVVMSSICGEQLFHGAPSEYAIAKLALNGFILSTSKKYQSTGIRVNALKLGHVLVEGSVWARKTVVEQSQALENIPLQSFCDEDDIGEALEYLLSPRSKYVNGATLRIDGGLSDRL